MSLIEDVWSNLTRDLPEQKHEWWDKIVANLSQSQRKYHNLELLQFKLYLYQSVKHLIQNTQSMEYALFFSYYEYDPRSADSYLKNIEHFKQFALDCCVPLESKLVCEVVSLLECTSSHMTEEHMTAGVVGKLDKHYFLDLDMSVLGSPPEEYQSYAERVRLEYGFFDKSAYNSLRVKVLQSFLQIPNIFATEEFRSRFEDQARKNIQKEISLLV
ncbi:uncharacterized protein [Rhodnius prolixus]